MTITITYEVEEMQLPKSGLSLCLLTVFYLDLSFYVKSR